LNGIIIWKTINLYILKDENLMISFLNFTKVMFFMAKFFSMFLKEND